jgi:proteasome lid subunit RPN8/RPN11
MKLIIKQELIEQLQKHALETYPFECCGFVFGSDQKEGRFITEVQPVANSKAGDQRRRFEIDPRDYLQAERYALNQDLVLLGIYHSHPDHPAVPSEHDLKQAVPFFSYLILATQKNRVDNITSWQLNQRGQFEEENIEIINQIETINNK